jgi:hypothetical protein
LTAFLVSLAALGLVFVLVQIVRKFVRKKQNSRRKKEVPSFQEFRQKAIAAGLTPQEAALLYEFTLESKLENPLNALWSYKSLDIVIKSVMQKFHTTEREKDAAGQEFLGKLLDLRKQITVQKLKARKRLSNSREVPAGQEVQVVLADVGIFTTKVIHDSFYFAVLSPIVFDLPPNFKWENRKVMIFFRKRNDGEYSFNTAVVQEIEDPKTHEFVLCLHHQETLSHTQKRQSIRVLLNRPAHIFPVGGEVKKNFAESRPCTLYDISDDGCAVIIQGKMEALRTVIIQVTLNNQLVGINGECLGIRYNKIKNVSVLHIRTNFIPREAKNIILSVMFGLISNDDEPPVSAAMRLGENSGYEKPAHQSNAAVLPSEQSESSLDENGPDSPLAGGSAEDDQAASGAEDQPFPEVPAE